MEIKIERAKSYFVLSQVLIILAGFLFASSGVAYNSVFNSFDKAVDLAISEPNNLSYNLTQEFIQIYGDLSITTFQLYQLFLIAGFIVTFLSIISWFIGNYKLKN